MLSSDTNNPREDSVFLRVKRAVCANGGPTAVVDLLRRFRALEASKSSLGAKGLTHADFLAMLSAFGVRLRDGEASYLCNAFDDAQDGFITAERFVRHFCGLNARRHAAVRRAWAVLPKETNGTTQCAPLFDRYALSGTRVDLDAAFSPAGEASEVGWEAFLAYYAAVSAEIALDEAFEVFLLREWTADAPTRPTMDETARDWGAEGDPLRIDGPRFVQDALNMSLGKSMKSYNYTHMQRVHPYREPLSPLERDYVSTMKGDFRWYETREMTMSNTLRHR